MNFNVDYPEAMEACMHYFGTRAEFGECSNCGGTGLNPSYCCSGFECGCHGQPIDFTYHCNECGQFAPPLDVLVTFCLVEGPSQ